MQCKKTNTEGLQGEQGDPKENEKLNDPDYWQRIEQLRERYKTYHDNYLEDRVGHLVRSLKDLMELLYSAHAGDNETRIGCSRIFSSEIFEDAVEKLIEIDIIVQELLIR